MRRNFTRKFLLVTIIKTSFVFVTIRTTFLTGICIQRKFCWLEKPILLMFNENSFNAWKEQSITRTSFLQDLFMRGEHFNIVSANRRLRGVECWDLKDSCFGYFGQIKQSIRKLILMFLLKYTCNFSF